MTETPVQCVVCREPASEEECVMDPQMGGMVCPGCVSLLMRAHVRLKLFDIGPALQPKHINQWNFKRFQEGYHESQ